MLRNVVSFCLGMGCFMSAASADTVTLVTTEYPPYYAASLPEKGVVSAITAAAFKKVGYDVTVAFLPWARAVSEVEKGTYDGLLGVWHSAERERFLVYSDPILDNEIGLVALKDRNISYKALSELKPYRIGTVRGYANPASFVEAGLTTDEANDDLTNLKKLIAGRVDLALVDKGVSDDLIAGHMPESKASVVWLEPPISKIPMFNGFAKNKAGYERRVADFAKGLSQLRASGEFAEIVKKYGFR